MEGKALRKLIVQSHRGGGALAPENTLESFITSWKFGAIPEADLRTTKDGVIVAFHDENFVRLVKDISPELREKGVQDVTWNELGTFDVGATQGTEFTGQGICRVEAIFALMRECSERELYLDIKNVDLAQLAALTTEYGVSRQVILASPRKETLREWVGLIPEGQTLLWMGLPAGNVEEGLRARLDSLRAEHFEGITQLQFHAVVTPVGDQWEFKPSLDFLQEVARELDESEVLFQLLPWDCGTPEVYRALVNAGVRSFASDYPEVALKILREWALSQPLSLLEALQSAHETKTLRIGEDVITEIPRIFQARFGNQSAVVIADTTTFDILGRQVCAAFESADHSCLEPFIFTDPALHAEYKYVVELENWLLQNEAIPVAVGSGVINDLVKLVAHRARRPYLCVATAASMDGYTAFGSSITYEGSKQTFTCPAPVAVVADLRILSEAPPGMTASGYADLMAKVTAGADWIVADALGVEAIDPIAWRIVQGSLRKALADPNGVAEGEATAIARLSEGLMLGGFAMQWSQSSRPASGAEHQFSHLWDMQHHTHEGIAPSHGFKVGIGTLAIAALYEYLLRQPLDDLDVDLCCRQWPEQSHIERISTETLGQELAELGVRETKAKYIGTNELRQQLEKLKQAWPLLTQRLQGQVLSFKLAEEKLRIVGAPFLPEQIGITRARLRQSFHQAALIRRRFTILDLALRTQTLDAALDHIFGEDGPWPMPT